MELAVILVLLVVAELAITCFLLGRIRDYRRTVDDLVNEIAGIEHGLDRAMTALGLAQSRLGVDANGHDDSENVFSTAAQVAASATPAEVEQARAVLESLGIKMD